MGVSSGPSGVRAALSGDWRGKVDVVVVVVVVVVCIMYVCIYV